jgi:hypothetical protein
VVVVVDSLGSVLAESVALVDCFDLLVVVVVLAFDLGAVVLVVVAVPVPAAAAVAFCAAEISESMAAMSLW